MNIKSQEFAITKWRVPCGTMHAQTLKQAKTKEKEKKKILSTARKPRDLIKMTGETCTHVYTY